MRSAMFSLSRDEDNIVFPYTCRIGPSPPRVPSAATIEPVALVFMGWACSRFACRETETICLQCIPSGPWLPGQHRPFETTR